jgi:hypothetical protein
VLFSFICKNIINILNIPDNNNYLIDPLYNSERGILYKCLQNVVTFDISMCQPRLALYNVTEISNKYLEEYTKLNEI